MRRRLSKIRIGTRIRFYSLCGVRLTARGWALKMGIPEGRLYRWMEEGRNLGLIGSDLLMWALGAAKGLREPVAPLYGGGEGGGDAVSRAWVREHGPGRPVMERWTSFDHVFRCACCGRVFPEEERREAGSEVCRRCVEDAGFVL